MLEFWGENLEADTFPVFLCSFHPRKMQTRKHFVTHVDQTCLVWWKSISKLDISHLRLPRESHVHKYSQKNRSIELYAFLCAVVHPSRTCNPSRTHRLQSNARSTRMICNAMAWYALEKRAGEPNCRKQLSNNNLLRWNKVLRHFFFLRLLASCSRVDVVVRLALVLMLIFVLLACAETWEWRRPNKSASFCQHFCHATVVIGFYRHHPPPTPSPVVSCFWCFSCGWAAPNRLYAAIHIARMYPSESVRVNTDDVDEDEREWRKKGGGRGDRNKRNCFSILLLHIYIGFVLKWICVYCLASCKHLRFNVKYDRSRETGGRGIGDGRTVAVACARSNWIHFVLFVPFRLISCFCFSPQHSHPSARTKFLLRIFLYSISISIWRWKTIAKRIWNCAGTCEQEIG